MQENYKLPRDVFISNLFQYLSSGVLLLMLLVAIPPLGILFILFWFFWCYFINKNPRKSVYSLLEGERILDTYNEIWFRDNNHKNATYEIDTIVITNLRLVAKEANISFWFDKENSKIAQTRRNYIISRAVLEDSQKPVTVITLYTEHSSFFHNSFSFYPEQPIKTFQLLQGLLEQTLTSTPTFPRDKDNFKTFTHI